MSFSLSADEVFSSVTPTGVTPLMESNDAAVLEAQLSSDELVSNEDISHTHNIILAGREEQAELELQLTTTLDVVPFTFDLWGLFRKGAINLILPFINGVMLGFGEILAHEVGFKYGFVGARVHPARTRVQPKSRYI